MARVQTGCASCKRCSNSKMAEFGRRQGTLWANLGTFGGVAAAQKFTADCRACGHKMSLHNTTADQNAAADHAVPTSPYNETRGRMT